MTASFAQAHENWAGSYGGLSLGVLMGTTTTTEYDGPWDYGEYSITDEAYAVGVLGGHNWLYGPAGFYGVELDFNWTNFNAERQWDTSPVYRNEGAWNWFGTLRARGGLAMDKTLLYVTGGIALVNADYAFGQIGSEERSSDTDVGYTAGAGVEFALDDNTSVRGEYLYIGLPSSETQLSGDTGDFVSSGNIARFAVIRGF